MLFEANPRHGGTPDLPIAGRHGEGLVVPPEAYDPRIATRAEPVPGAAAP